MKIKILFATVAACVAAAATAQADDATKRYIDAGFAAMDINKDGKVEPAEFDRFMRARLARQGAKFDQTFGQLDKDGNGTISRSEAQSSSAIMAKYFDFIDADKSGGISKSELRSAMIKSQAEEVTGK
ncbi:EF-hand domain-containing protein [Sphingomonas sp. S-NIH.Pt15_0812]|uniref:EF-hand domain-containing protein n=1 Tax=Sphingomonas sp. S-NIH.Pt15_0812 TaxID=1920129 RepID=UPI000F7E9E62|nr:EF-hand domain-containing protein [Sphingomonas sp. S-NIH.Pt15_0812]RSU45536.1 hypothetical protein BRX43_18515 [Sphingomonas sp. S-NIH.Pt15_0812]